MSSPLTGRGKGKYIPGRGKEIACAKPKGVKNGDIFSKWSIAPCRGMAGHETWVGSQGRKLERALNNYIKGLDLIL